MTRGCNGRPLLQRNTTKHARDELAEWKKWRKAEKESRRIGGQNDTMIDLSTEAGMLSLLYRPARTQHSLMTRHRPSFRLLASPLTRLELPSIVSSSSSHLSCLDLFSRPRSIHDIRFHLLFLYQRSTYCIRGIWNEFSVRFESNQCLLFFVSSLIVPIRSETHRVHFPKISQFQYHDIWLTFMFLEPGNFTLTS